MALNSKQAAQLKAFGANVRRERTAQKITQEKLAELVDLNIRTIQKIEAGHVNRYPAVAKGAGLFVGRYIGEVMKLPDDRCA